MENTLKKVILDFNWSREGSSGSLRGGDAAAVSSQAPLQKIVEILNEHHNSLVWIDAKTR